MPKVSRLKRRELEKAVTLFQKGLSLEVPPGRMDAQRIRRELGKTICYVHDGGNGVDGLVSFRLNRSGNVTIFFICTSRLRKGIGSKLMLEVAKFAQKRKIGWIYSGVSSKDRRAGGFYHSLGFRNYSATARFGYYVRARPAGVIARHKN